MRFKYSINPKQGGNMAEKVKQEKEKGELVKTPLVLGIVETPIGTIVKVLHQKYRGVEFTPMSNNNICFNLDSTKATDTLYISDFPKLTVYNAGAQDMYVQMSVKGSNKTYDGLACLIQKKHAKEVVARLKELVKAYNTKRLAFETSQVDEEDDYDLYTCEIEKCS